MGFVDKIFRKRNESSGSKTEKVTTTNKPEDLVNANNDTTRYVEGSIRINWSSLGREGDGRFTTIIYTVIERSYVLSRI